MAIMAYKENQVMKINENKRSSINERNGMAWRK